MTDNENIAKKEHPDLYKRSIKGGYWVFGIKFATQFLGFVKSIIVFNFLFNENLELIFVANLLMAALTSFSESGFRAALVQKKEDIESYLDTAWVIGILRGIVLFAAIYFAAPLFASFKVEPEKMSLAINVIRAMGVCFLIRAFQNIGVVYFQKELQFNKTFWLTMAGKMTDIAISISLLLIYRSVWAVVIARLAAGVVNLMMSYLMCSYRPKFHFVPEKARELWKFGKWLFGGNIIGHLLNEGDDWFVLFFFPDSLPFKLYRGAYRFANMPATHITNTISQVSFPAYSKIQNDISRLREAYLKVLQITVLISVPVAFLIFTLGPDFVRLFLVEESHAMIPVLQILAIYGLVRSIGATRGALFPATGNVHIVFRFSLIRIGLLIITIYPLTDHWGIAGTAASILLARLLVGPLGLLLASRILRCSIWSMIREYLLPLSASILTGGVILLLKMYLFKELTRLSFLGLLLTGILIYLIVICIVGITFKSGIYLNIKEQKELFFSKKRRSPD